MPTPTINDVQAIEPVLTNMLVGFSQADARFVASRVFPNIPVDKDSGTYYIFSQKYFWTDDMKPRAPGAPFPSGDFGVETDTYKTLQFALEKVIADETRRNSQVPMDLETAAVRWLNAKNLIKKEVAFSTDFMTTGVWGTSNTTATDWDDFSAGDPVNDIMTARRTISNNTGLDPNTMVVGYIVHQALANHPDIVDRVAYVQRADLDTIEAALAAILGLPNYLVAKGTYAATNEGQTMTATAIVDDDALVCYVTPTPGIWEASAGYTFGWDGGGGPGSIYNVRDDRNHADAIQIKAQWDQKAVSTACGYFFSDIV
jgi:hypothetical protein